MKKFVRSLWVIGIILVYFVLDLFKYFPEHGQFSVVYAVTFIVS